MDKNEIKKIIKENILINKINNNDNYYFIDNNWTWIFDFRRWILQSDILEKFSCFFRDLYEKEFPFQIWWIEAWAIPLISWIILEWQKRWKKTNWFFVRKERKEKWLWNTIEWNLDENKIIIVDDILNSWESLIRVKKWLDNIKRNIYKVFLFVNFWTERWKYTIHELKLNIEYLFNLWDFWLEDTWTKWFSKYPIIFPKLKKLYHEQNQNLFLNSPKSSPIFYDWKIYTWFESWYFYSLCANTWNIIWSFNVCQKLWHKNILSSPILVKNNIIFWAYNWNLYFINIDNWDINYIFEKADFIWSSPCYDEKNNLLYVWLEYSWNQNKWSLIAIDFDTKKIIWEHYFDDFVHASPETKNWLVICWWNDWKIIIVEWKSWTIIYEIEINSPVKWWFTFDEKAEKCYFWTHDNFFYCLNIISWNFEWKFKTDDIIYTKALIIKNNIFFWSLDKSFYHLNIKWKKQNQIITSWKIFWEAINYNNFIIFSSQDWYIYFYNLKSKSIIYCIYHWEKINNKMVLNDNILYVIDFNWWVYKYFISNFLK